MVEWSGGKLLLTPAIQRNSSAHALAASGVLDEEPSGQVGGVRLQQPAELPADPNQMRLLSDSFVLLPSDEGSTDIAGIVEVLLHFRRQCKASDIPLEFFFSRCTARFVLCTVSFEDVPLDWVYVSRTLS